VYVFATHLVSPEFFNLEATKPLIEIRDILNNANKFCDTLGFRNGKLEDLCILIEIDAEVSVRDTNNNTAVHFIAVVYSIDIIKLLMGKYTYGKLTNIHDDFLSIFQLNLAICKQENILF
jgi:hypothetical protein